MLYFMLSTRILACNYHRPKQRFFLFNDYADHDSNFTFWRLNIWLILLPPPLIGVIKKIFYTALRNLWH